MKRLKALSADILEKSGFFSRGGEWSVAIYAGQNPYTLKPQVEPSSSLLTWRHVTDVRAGFIADPFLALHEGVWHMFFEVWNKDCRRGEIGLALSRDLHDWAYDSIVLREPFHLSYPYVFKSGGEYYMVPESHQDNSVRLYRARNFPHDWVLCSTILAGQCFQDSSVFQHDGHWYLFTDTQPGARSSTLRLYCAEKVIGPWEEHPASPLIVNKGHAARPAGRVVCEGQYLLRYAQDSFPRYGSRVVGVDILELSPTKYRESSPRERPVIEGSGRAAWNGLGMHHVDPHRLGDSEWVACVDGISAAHLSLRRHVPRGQASLDGA